jgi:fermentation-respiration switch protein FrsA (DUF1100 family)
MKRPRKLGTALVEVLAACLLLFFMLRWFEHKQVYYPSRTMEAAGAALGRPFEDVVFKARDGVILNGWFFPASTNALRQHLAILFCHGNAGNISHRLDTCLALLATGVNVFVFDYRGYGRSQGRPSEEGTYLDAQAAYQWLRRKGIAGTNIVAFGESLGGGVAAELAAREPLGGLVLQSSFTSIPDMGAELFPWLPVRWLGTIKYDTHSKLTRLHVPVLVMHSPTDELVGFHHAQKNFAVANEPKLFWTLQGDHNSPLADSKHFIAGLEKFLALAEARTALSPGGEASKASPKPPSTKAH